MAKTKTTFTGASVKHYIASKANEQQRADCREDGPTLKGGESALATRSFDSLSRGDIVAFRYPKDESKSFVQRIVALPGERIESRDGNKAVWAKVLR